eukprot:4966700-Prymnesium_polylepis.1
MNKGQNVPTLPASNVKQHPRHHVARPRRVAPLRRPHDPTAREPHGSTTSAIRASASGCEPPDRLRHSAFRFAFLYGSCREAPDD